MSEAAIQVNHIFKSYGRCAVLKDISAQFEKGKIHGLIGRNGSGKTQLFKIIAGYVAADQGEVIAFGKKVGKQVHHPERMGILIEIPGFLPNYSGLFNLQMLAAMNSKLTRAQLIETLEKVGLHDAIHKKVSRYSLGMRQRLGIAQAIMGNPELIILDEPFNGLDYIGVAEIRKLILQCREAGKTILLSSHYAEDIDRLCDTVRRMEAGALRE